MTELKVIYVIEVNVFITKNTSYIKQTINCGVYYKLYINDITNVSDIVFSMPFCDDANVFIHSEHLYEITGKNEYWTKNTCGLVKC